MANNNYVDNKKFHAELVEHKRRVLEAAANGKPKPQINNYIGSVIMLIAERFSLKPSYRNYIFREEMVMNAVENAIRYLDNYDVSRTNPLAYFTQIVYYSFLRTIDKEKIYLYTKFKNIERFNLFENATDKQLHDEYSSYGQVDEVYQAASTQDNANEFVKEFEKKKKEKGIKSNANKKKNSARISDGIASGNSVIVDGNEE